MLFVEDFIKPRKGSGNIETDEGNVDGVESETEVVESKCVILCFEV